MKFPLATIIASMYLTTVMASRDPEGDLLEGHACNITWAKGNGSQDSHY